jgi:hypothetical protein
LYCAGVIVPGLMVSKPLKTCMVLPGLRVLLVGVDRALLALQFPQHVRHAHAGKARLFQPVGLVSSR